jgi:hypothetical protein
VVLLPLAAGASEGEAALHVDPAHPTLATLSEDWMEEVGAAPAFGAVQWTRRVTVGVSTLDALMARYGRPDFCKIDVEGYEEEVLEGLSAPLPALSFEYLPQAWGRAARCLSLLEDLAPYRYYISRRETMRFISQIPMTAGEVREFLSSLKDGDAAGDIYALCDPEAGGRR